MQIATNDKVLIDGSEKHIQYLLKNANFACDGYKKTNTGSNSKYEKNSRKLKRFDAL